MNYNFSLCLATLVFAAFTTAAPEACAQTKAQTITVIQPESTLKDFIRAVESQSNYTFVFGQDIDLSLKIRAEFKDLTLPQILQAALTPLGIKWKIEKSHIILKSADSRTRKITISGYVTDAASGESLIGANVIDRMHQTGGCTNNFGFYSVPVYVGETAMNYSFTGYSSQLHQLNIQNDTVINISLKSDLRLEEVMVSAEKSTTGFYSASTGSIEMPISKVRNTPSLLGESDVIKSIQMLPGADAAIEGFSGLLVRGGSPDQNLYMFDGIPIYSIDHLFGFFSVFDPQIVKKMDFYKGSFPARFGGRLSSVVDIRSNDGDLYNYHGAFSIGLLSSKFNLEGPIVKGRTAFNLSLRRSYMDLIARPFMSGRETYYLYFYDANIKLNHKFNDRSRLFLGFYQGRDCMGMDKKSYSSDYYSTMKSYDMNWGNRLASLRWNYQLNDVLFLNTTVSYNNYNMKYDNKDTAIDTYEEYCEESVSKKYHSGIEDVSANVDFDYYHSENHSMKFGAGLLHHHFSPDVETSQFSQKENAISTDTLYQAPHNSELDAEEISLYMEDQFQAGEKCLINIGARFSGFFVGKKNYFSLEPRLSLRYALSSDWAVKASYNTMSQYISLLSTSAISMPTDLWVPITDNLKPMRSHQFSTGLYLNRPNGWEFSLEAYAKLMNNVLEYKDGFGFLGSSRSWDCNVAQGKGRSAGIETTIRKNTGRTTGWISYTLAKSDRKFSQEVNEGKRFPFKYDRRHSIKMMLTHRFSKKVEVNAAWSYITGGTATIPLQRTVVSHPTESSRDYSYGNNIPGVFEIDYNQGRNNYRLPASHLLNLGINFIKQKKHGIRTWNISIYNVYCAANPTLVYKSTSWPSKWFAGDQNQIVVRKKSLFPIVPSVSYSYKF